MRPPSVSRERTTTLAVLVPALIALLGFLGAPSARAGAFPITESFSTTAMGSDWHAFGPAHLTADADGNGNGWMRLTDAVNAQFGSVIDDVAFPSDDGVLAEFEYATHDGTAGSADGLTFFLYDGATTLGDFHTGPVGGSIGYTNCADPVLPGLSGAYIGVAFDEYGNFSNSTFCGQEGGSAADLQPGRVAVRAGAAANYRFLTSAPVTGGLLSSRAQARKIVVTITPDMLLSVYITSPDGSVQTVTSDYPLPADAPPTLKMGFVAATGSQNNIHEIRSVQVVLPADLSATVTDSAAGTGRGAHTWTSVVTNAGPNAVTGASVKATSNLPGVSDVTWSCVASGGASCGVSAGTGLPDTTVDLPVHGSVTYTMTGDVASTADATSLTVDAEHAGGGETGESDPTDNSATDLTDLTPVFTGPSLPTFTLSGAGLADSGGSHGTSWLGANLAYASTWQRCDVDGTDCADIPGAGGTTYSTVAADQGKTIRLKVTATNAAGSDTAYSLPFSQLPDTTITSKPDALTNATTGAFAFTQSGAPGATTFECALDGEAFAPCTSTKTYTSLTDGDHTVQVRATYGGLSDPTPATYAWTVDTQIAAAIAAPDDGAFLGENRPAIHLAGDAGDTYSLTIDGDPAGAGTLGASGATFTPTSALADGPHAFVLTVEDAAGNAATDTVAVTIDTASPAAPTLDAGPPATTSSATPTFTVTGEVHGTLLCRLDAGAWEPCPSPLTFPDLPEGQHAVSFRTRDQAGNESTPTTSAFTIDQSTSLTITGPQPGNIADARPTVTAQAEPGAAVSIEVDGVVVATGTVGSDGTVAITLPAALPDGDHTILTTVTDAAGNAVTGETRLHVDTRAPGTPTIPQGPAATSSSHDATFTFTGEQGSTLRCSLDGGTWQDCSPPLTLTALGDGAHTLSVIATDASGNDSPHQDYAWTIDTAPPAAPPAMTSPGTKSAGSTARFVFSLEPGSSLECSVDGGAFGPCDPDVDLSGLRDGHHTLVVRQIDAAGNSGSPARYEWTVVATPPKAHAATRLKAKIAARTTAADNRRMTVGCDLDQPNLRWCAIRATHRDTRGHDVLIGTGRATVAKAGNRSTVVRVTLNAAGRRLLERAVGGLAVRLTATAQGQGSKVLSASAATVLSPQRCSSCRRSTRSSSPRRSCSTRQRTARCTASRSRSAPRPR